MTGGFPAAAPLTESVFFGAAQRVTFLLVEGASDQKLWELFVDSQVCQVRAMDGREKVIAALDVALSEKRIGLVGVIDSDFDRINNTVLVRSDLVTTDFHDIDITIIMSGAFNKVVKYLSSRTKGAGLRFDELRAQILEAAAWVGRLRWLSLKKEYGLCFRKSKGDEFSYPPFPDFVDRQTLQVNVEQMVRSVLNFSNKYPAPINKIVEELDQMPEHDPRHVCVGHDVYNILKEACRRLINNKNVSVPELQEKFHLAFEFCFLEETQMYQTLVAWESSNPPYRIFGPPTPKKARP